MPDIFYLITGIIILTLVQFDFFYTTLSGSGASFITRQVANVIHESVRILSTRFGRRILIVEGLLLNMSLMTVWLLLVWAGLFFIFTYHPEGVINSSGRVASVVGRVYYTGYVLSTLGLGNFKPITPFFEIVTSLFSFFGFVFFTTTMTYFISLSSSLMQKRTLAITIYNLGKSPEELIQTFHETPKEILYQYFSNLQQMIDRYTINH